MAYAHAQLFKELLQKGGSLSHLYRACSLHSPAESAAAQRNTLLDLLIIARGLKQGGDGGGGCFSAFLDITKGPTSRTVINHRLSEKCSKLK